MGRSELVFFSSSPYDNIKYYPKSFSLGGDVIQLQKQNKKKTLDEL